MQAAGHMRHQVALALRAAYGEGLLSQHTLAHRLDLLFGSLVVDPRGLVGDLAVRRPRGRHAAGAREALRRALRALGGGPAREPAEVVLALDWSGAWEEIIVGRHPECDVVLDDETVSRRHARLVFRDGAWVLRDLESTNGTTVNGSRVARCRLLPGDHLRLGDVALLVD